VVPDPNGKGSVYVEWRRANAVADTAEPAMGDPGGGSDFAGFYNHLGIPIADWGFGGAGGVYHSQYDSYAWMTRFGDPGFQYHATAAKIGAVMALRVANADVLPYDYAEYARTIRLLIDPIERRVEDRKWSASTASLRAAVDRLEREATVFNTTRDSVLRGQPAKAVLERTNRALMQVERAVTRPEGLKTRPWFRNLIYVADENNGYANMPLPSVNEAIRTADEALTRRELADLAARFNRAADAVATARASLLGR
jgi:N-acetylated-alpha-linked acidic dipeptidase